MVMFLRDKDEGVRARVIYINRDDRTMRVQRESDEVILALDKCVKPVRFDNGLVCYDETGCAEGLAPNDPIRILTDGHWLTQFDYEHAPKVSHPKG